MKNYKIVIIDAGVTYFPKISSINIECNNLLTAIQLALEQQDEYFDYDEIIDAKEEVYYDTGEKVCTNTNTAMAFNYLLDCNGSYCRVLSCYVNDRKSVDLIIKE